MDAASLIAELTQRADGALSPELSLADVPGWDSLKMVRLVVQIETALDRELSEAELDGLERVSDVQRLLNKA